jgi:hypothetical protein
MVNRFRTKCLVHPCGLCRVDATQRSRVCGVRDLTPAASTLRPTLKGCVLTIRRNSMMTIVRRRKGTRKSLLMTWDGRLNAASTRRGSSGRSAFRQWVNGTSGSTLAVRWIQQLSRSWHSQECCFHAVNHVSPQKLIIRTIRPGRSRGTRAPAASPSAQTRLVQPQRRPRSPGTRVRQDALQESSIQRMRGLQQFVGRQLKLLAEHCLAPDGPRAAASDRR